MRRLIRPAPRPAARAVPLGQRTHRHPPRAPEAPWAAAGTPAPVSTSPRPADAASPAPEQRFFDAAEALRRLAVSWGDQSYGAVLVADGVIVGVGPSRVVVDRNPDAHAERVALRDAQQRLGRPSLAGAVLYSTSRPCRACEAAAAAAGVARMIHGSALQDAGPPMR
ncbi:MAG: nucleoside deaminase [Rubrivivax sp.]|nr:nucleoside deaminase [Rubrivivax sp.]